MPSATAIEEKSNAKAVAQVVTALKKLDKGAGPTLTDICSFISKAINNPVTKNEVKAI